MNTEQIEEKARFSDSEEADEIARLLQSQGLHYLGEYVRRLQLELQETETEKETIEDTWIDPENFDGEIDGEYWMREEDGVRFEDIHEYGYVSREDTSEAIAAFVNDFERLEIKEKEIGGTDFVITTRENLDELMGEFHSRLSDFE